MAFRPSTAPPADAAPGRTSAAATAAGGARVVGAYAIRPEVGTSDMEANQDEERLRTRIKVAVMGGDAEVRQHVAELVTQSPNLTVEAFSDDTPNVTPSTALRAYDVLLVGLDTNAQESLAVVKRMLAQTPMCGRSEEHTSELQSQSNLVCRLLLEKKKKTLNMISKTCHVAFPSEVGGSLRVVGEPVCVLDAIADVRHHIAHIHRLDAHYAAH